MRILILGMFCFFTFLGNLALAAYPEKAIRIIVPYKAGGGTDSIARGFVSAFSKAAGVDVVITNVNGGAGSKGIIQVMKAKPDGYNLILTGSTDIIGLSTFRKMPFKSIGSLTPVGGVYTTPTYVLAHKDRGYKTLEEVIEKSKANPGKLIAGIGGKFGAHDVLANAVNGYKNAGFRIVAFDGGAMLKKATIANEVDICIIHSPVLLNEVKAGLLNVIGTGGSLAKITYPPIQKTKTLREMGIPADVGVTRGVWAPKGTPKDIIAKLEKFIEVATNSEEFKKFGNNFGFAPKYYTSSQFLDLLNLEQSVYNDIKGKFMSK
ncbi:tripartite tricarboxylate transporter substrate binding protein [Alphaproteobacteria bacterium]|nr:tripartite tricarboxylate transporter substrate binding protein [Alphaproteobacteria bacterium]